jgi:DnaJ family protein B protein 12
MKQKQYARAVKFFQKSLSLYPLPGVEALLATAERAASTGDDNTNPSSSTNENDANTTNTNTYARSTSTASSTTSSTGGRGAAGSSSTGRSYTQANVEIVEKILAAKANGGRTAHYKVLGISATECTEADIKKAYRKLAIKVHPDKNSAPKADEAFKAVGLAYATLSDPQKKAIYDRYGDEDPDNRGGGGGGGGMRHRGPGGMHFRPGDEVSPEDIFNMFFGGMAGGPGMHGMHRGPGGMHFYTNFGGPAGGFARAQQQQQQRRGTAGPAEEGPGPGLGNLIQLLPFLLIMLLSFMNMTDNGGKPSTGSTPRNVGEGRYFSLMVSVM